MLDFSSRVKHLEMEGAYVVMAHAQELEAQGKISFTWRLDSLISKHSRISAYRLWER
ncbi:MAG: hypothetical protein ABFD51_09745 [Anaerolineaceae bacterium]